MRKDIKPCQFCDNNVADFIRIDAILGQEKCLKCGARGPLANSEAEASLPRTAALAEAVKALEHYASYCELNAEGHREPYKHEPLQGSNVQYSECVGCLAKTALARLRSPELSRVAEATQRVIETADQFERETNIPLSHKDLALAARRRSEFYEAVIARRAALAAARRQEGA